MKHTAIPKRQFIPWALLFGFILVLTIPFYALADEECQFERMWPTLQQPWYFNEPMSVALDNNGYVYLTEAFNDRVQKFTSDGQFVANWGSYGTGNGKFAYPHGIAVSPDGYVYVTDKLNSRIQKFTSDGQFVRKWGTKGSGNGELWRPLGIAVDSEGYVYVTEEYNHRVQKFTSNGQFVTKWGSNGYGDGELGTPRDVVVDDSGYVYVVDYSRHCVQKFTSDGQFVSRWGSEGSQDGELNWPTGIALDASGYIYVTDSANHRVQKFTSDGQFITKWADIIAFDIAIDTSGYAYVTDFGNDSIQKFTPNGQLVSRWGSGGSSNGEFNEPYGIALGNTSYVYIADRLNSRIQKFTPEGQFVTEWGSYGTGNGEFYSPRGIAVDPSGYVYVVNEGFSYDDEVWRANVQKFTSNGQFVMKWGTYGTGDGEFKIPYGIAIDGDGAVYVADTYNYRIQKFTSSGQLVTKWGSYGEGDGEFTYPLGIAADNAGYVYVAENIRIQKFTSAGQFVTKWGAYGSGDGEFDRLLGIEVDSAGFVYAADTGNHRIQKFKSDGQFVAKWGDYGSEPGGFNEPSRLAINLSGQVFVTDTKNNRVQVFSQGTAPTPSETVNKAIIVAGGGPFAGNNIWDATQMCANFAYRALTYQGYTNDTIYYLTSDTDLDLNGDGILDDVDADATNSNFQSAITSWAQDAENLFIYMCDHGGNGTFRMGATELLQASALDTSLDTIQGTIPGNVVVVYDACRSGSFLASLIPPIGKERILLTSASANEEALFCSGGSVSFSFFFWGRMFNGDSFYDSYVNAKDSIGVTYNQTPQIEGNGNGIGNERADRDAARLVTIGNETRTGADIPVIGSVSAMQTLGEETSASIYAANVIDADGISRVWAVITPPNYSPGSPDNPVTDLPILDLQSVGNNRYQATYASFTETGTYNVAIYAADAFGIMSLPIQTTVDKGAEPTPLNVSGFTTDLTGPTPVQTPVSITFTAQGDSETLYYRYYQASGYQTQNYGNWQQLVDWTTDNSFIWFPYSEDHYIILAHVTDDPTSENYHQAGLSIETSGNSANPIQITNFTTGMDYPQPSGAAISFDTTASGGSGTLYYRYYYRKLPSGQWTEITAYGTDNTCTWTPPGDGLYIVVVQVTDNPSGNTFSTAGMTCTIGE